MAEPKAAAMQRRVRVATSVEQLRGEVATARAAGDTIGLVPTMGALHEGHLSLVRAACEECDFTLATIFVNPTQFGPREDFQKYPRTLDQDLESLDSVGTDLVFVPERESIYPAGFSTYVEAPEVARLWEGPCRPGHFRAVATVVLKLFNLAQVDLAYFGQKDYQQARVIQSMAEDLDVPTVIRTCPTVRESDGLAMSSRNRYLDAEQRRRALALWQSLSMARDLVIRGERDAIRIGQRMEQQLFELGVDRIDYAALADPVTLQPATRIQGPVVALIAAFVGQTRLIDNLVLEP